ncbi:MAG: FadR/GntR family transcriptional regulator [Pseudomonadota bacterium]
MYGEPGKTSAGAHRFARIDVTPAYRQVFEAVEGALLRGELQPGDPLPSEMALAAQLGVNRSTAREGLRLLEESGLVERSGRRRLFAAIPGEETLSTRASRALLLRKVRFRELWQLLMALEPAAAALAASAANEDDLQALEANVRATAAVVERGESFVRLDSAFHTLVAQATHNTAWPLTHEPVATLIFPAMDRLLPRLPWAGDRLLEAHRRIVAAIAARDADTAARWMRRHIEDFARGCELAGLDMDDPVGLASSETSA